ncbi:hypothetical protein [Stutzerimonas nitrititolerans]|uniref:hypothetical protein n=1 Tax=Stutzerimonas nitrititolerans TaxID=2482751 RepID=UPI0028AEFB54|nr:hypothetical protein [Stutzerimonas nitrititolerans]
MLQSKTPAKASDLLNDLELQDVPALNLSRAVQIWVDIAVFCRIRRTVGLHLGLIQPTTAGATICTMNMWTENVSRALSLAATAIHD